MIMTGLIVSLLLNAALLLYTHNENEHKQVKTRSILYSAELYVEKSSGNISELRNQWLTLSKNDKIEPLTEASKNLEFASLLSNLGGQYFNEFKVYKNKIELFKTVFEHNSDEVNFEYLEKLGKDLGIIDVFYMNALMNGLSKDDMYTQWTDEKKKLILVE